MKSSHAVLDSLKTNSNFDDGVDRSRGDGKIVKDEKEPGEEGSLKNIRTPVKSGP